MHRTIKDIRFSMPLEGMGSLQSVRLDLRPYLDRPLTSSIVTDCARALNGITDDNGGVVSRSRADPVDEKYHQLIYEAVHDEIRKDAFKDQMIIISLSACTFRSNEAGEPLQGINKVIRCCDQQRIFSNKSDNLYVIQHCDFTQEAREAMGSYSYHEFDIVHKVFRPENHGWGIHAMFVGSDEKLSIMDAELFVPPGTESAHGVSLRNRADAVSGGTHAIVALNSASTFNNVSTMSESQLMITNDVTNPMAGAARGPSHGPLDQDPAFLNSISNKSPADQRQLIADAQLLSISKPGSLDAVYAAQMLNYGAVPLEIYHDYIATSDGELGTLHTLFHGDITFPSERMIMTNGGNNMQELSLTETTSFGSAAELGDVNNQIRGNQAQVGEVYFTGVGGCSAEANRAMQDMSNRGENPRGRAGAFTSRAVTRAQDVASNPQSYPQLPVDTARVGAWTRGDLEPPLQGGNRRNGGAGDHRSRAGDPNLSAQERARERQNEEAARRDRDNHAKKGFEKKR